MRGTHDEWSLVCDAIRADTERGAASPFESPNLPRLYELARHEGARCLRTFASIPPTDQLDLIHDVLISALAEILAADRPRGLFRTALKRRAIDRGRRASRLEGADGIDSCARGTPERREPPIDELRALRDLCRRDREILVAVVLGEDRDELAKRYGFESRDAIDQIVSRARKKLREGT